MHDQEPLNENGEKACAITALKDERDDAYHCPVCHAVIPPEQIGKKVWCRKCGYLESCCNPI